MSSHGVPEVLMKKVDEYVDSLAPQIQPRIATEIEVFQEKTINSLEGQVVDAFRSLFKQDKGGSGDGSRSAWSLNDAVPDSYGGQALPFANEIAQLTRGFSKITDEAGDDLREIFDLTEGNRGQGETRSRGGGNDAFSQGARGFLSAAINAVQDHLDDDKGPRGSGFELDGLLGVISNTVKDAARNPEEKARLITPEIKEIVSSKLREQHAPIAEQFTRIALDHIKRWLRGNTSTRDLGDGVKGEIKDHVEDLVKGLGSFFTDKSSPNEGASRGFNDNDRGDNDGESRGFSKVISDKLSTGLAKVHREVRLEFRKVLGAIEKQLFELLPDVVQRPLEKILGGNPFDSQLDRDASPQADRGFGDDLKAKLVKKIRDLVRKVQETLRESVLGVVNGGHRKFERESWVFVQNIVEQKVQKYLPKVKISVPDDIGNENVSVGSPTSGTQIGGNQGPAHEQHGGNSNFGQGYNPPSQHQSGNQYNRPQEYQEGYRPNERPHEYRPGDHQQEYRQNERPNEYRQEYRPNEHSNEYRPNDHQQDYRQNERPHDYRQNDHQQDYRPNEHRQDYRSSDYQQDYRPGQQQSSDQYRNDQYQPSQQGYSQQHQYDQHQSRDQQYQSDQNYGHHQGQSYGQNPRY